MILYLKKFLGQSIPIPIAPPFKQIAFISAGVFIATSVIALLALYSNQPLILGSFGASIFVLFVLSDTPFAQPRNVIGSHIVSSLFGLFFFHVISPEWWSMALSLATTIAVVQVLKIPHPPAASNPFIIFLTAPSWSFLIIPTLVGSILLIIIALFYINLSKEKTYPKYW